MRQILSVLLVLLLSFGILGCSPSNGSEEPPASTSGSAAEFVPVQDPVNNELFTGEFFKDVVEIAAVGAGVVRGDQLQPVIQYFQSLTLTRSDTHLIPESDTLTGLGAISFRKSDGTEIVFNNNHGKMTCVEGLDLCSYVLESGNLNQGMREAFDRAIEQYPE